MTSGGSTIEASVPVVSLKAWRKVSPGKPANSASHFKQIIIRKVTPVFSSRRLMRGLS